MLVDTPRGPARLHLDVPVGTCGALLVLGHAAGGSVSTADLQAVTHAATGAGVAVVRVEQPYRVAGRRAPAPAGHLDEAWIAAVSAAREHGDPHLPLVVGGRSSGARVAARTCPATGAVGLLALAFPLVNPRGISRQGELDLVAVPTLILQGGRDRFGVPPGTANRQVHVFSGADHGLRVAPDRIAAVVTAWLGDLLNG